MKVIVSKDEDAQLLIAKLRNKEGELRTRFRQQSTEQEHVVDEVMRGVNFVIVDWLQSQGFKLT